MERSRYEVQIFLLLQGWLLSVYFFFVAWSDGSLDPWMDYWLVLIYKQMSCMLREAKTFQTPMGVAVK